MYSNHIVPTYLSQVVWSWKWPCTHPTVDDLPERSKEKDPIDMEAEHKFRLIFRNFYPNFSRHNEFTL